MTGTNVSPDPKPKPVVPAPAAPPLNAPPENPPPRPPLPEKALLLIKPTKKKKEGQG